MLPARAQDGPSAQSLSQKGIWVARHHVRGWPGRAEPARPPVRWPQARGPLAAKTVAGRAYTRGERPCARPLVPWQGLFPGHPRGPFRPQGSLLHDPGHPWESALLVLPARPYPDDPSPSLRTSPRGSVLPAPWAARSLPPPLHKASPFPPPQPLPLPYSRPPLRRT